MPLFDQYTGRVILTVLLIAAGLGFVWMTWHVLVAFLFAIFFAYLIDPVVRFVNRRTKLTRGAAIGVVYLAVFLLLAALLLFIGPGMVHEASKLADTLPDLYQKVASGQIAWQIGAQHGWSYETKVRIQQFLAGHSDDIIRIARDFASHLAQSGRNAWWLALIPILAIFFLKDGEQFGQAVVNVFARQRQREFMEGVINDLNLMLAHYIRSQLILATLAMAAYIVGLNVLRVPYATILGVIAGVGEFIPMVGPLISSLLILGVALGAGYTHLVPLILFLAIWRCLQDYVNSPRIMGRQLELHPLATLFGVLAGAEVAGIIGVYLSIPVVATVRIFWRRWRAYSSQGAGATSANAGDPPPGAAAHEGTRDSCAETAE